MISLFFEGAFFWECGGMVGNREGTTTSFPQCKMTTLLPLRLERLQQKSI